MNRGRVPSGPPAGDLAGKMGDQTEERAAESSQMSCLHQAAWLSPSFRLRLSSPGSTPTLPRNILGLSSCSWPLHTGACDTEWGLQHP